MGMVRSSLRAIVPRPGRAERGLPAALLRCHAPTGRVGSTQPFLSGRPGSSASRRQPRAFAMTHLLLTFVALGAAPPTPPAPSRPADSVVKVTASVRYPDPLHPWAP